MSSQRFAAGTEVPISQSREEIDRLLRAWGASAVAWSDEFDLGRMTLRFVWKHKGDSYRPRFHLQFPSKAKVQDAARNTRGELSEQKFRRLWERRGRQEMRTLLLLLKAIFNAAELGIIDATDILMPFFEGDEGRTVAEVIRPSLQKMAALKALPARSE